MTLLERPLGSGASSARGAEPAAEAGSREGAPFLRSLPDSIVAAPPKQHAAHSTVSTAFHDVTVEPPSGGDSSASTRSAYPRVAPAPVRVLARVTVLAAAFFLVHAAAANLLTAVAFAAAVLLIPLALATRR